MQRHFDQDLANLKDQLMTMAGHAENSVTMAIQAVVERNDEVARKVIEYDNILDKSEIELDEQCINLLALKAPMASDLRLITVAMKVIQNLERIGDEATKIARRALELNREPALKAFVDIPRMGSLSIAMLKSALDAFVHGDTIKAKELIQKDSEIDNLNKQLNRELISFMLEDPQKITRSLYLMVVSKSLERIADHATNIAEEVVFLQEGADIRHEGHKA
jgi:phosphate transport system protein